MINWKNVRDELPKVNKRYLGYCCNEYDSNIWSGIVEVYFDPCTGWHRCENYDNKPLCVLFWTDIIELPQREKP